MSGTDVDAGGVESARMRSSRKNATKMCIATAVAATTTTVMMMINK